MSHFQIRNYSIIVPKLVKIARKWVLGINSKFPATEKVYAVWLECSMQAGWITVMCLVCHRNKHWMCMVGWGGAMMNIIVVIKTLSY